MAVAHTDHGGFSDGAGEVGGGVGMPQFRKLHTKITESFDVNDMPDDFHRLLWSWLPLALCKEGRGVFHGGWIKSKVMPLREDITADDIMLAMDYFSRKRLIQRYNVDGREYFYIPTWHEYQNTSRDAESQYPEPFAIDKEEKPNHEELLSNSGVTQEQVALREDKRRQEENTPLASFDDVQEAVSVITGLPPAGESSVKAIRELLDQPEPR